MLEKDPSLDYSKTCKPLSFVVHNVDEMPTSFGTVDLCEFKHGMSLKVLITPEVLLNDDALQSFPVSEKKWYMENEKKLKYFKKYSVGNCEIECTSIFTFERRNSTLKICSFLEHECYKNSELEVKLGDKSEHETARNCKCLPTCTTINYKLEYLFNEIRSDLNDSAGLDKVTINFRFKDEEFLPYRRYRRMDFIGFLAETAGLLGLYCGVSILTIIELGYFLMKRPVSDTLRRCWRTKSWIHEEN